MYTVGYVKPIFHLSHYPLWSRRGSSTPISVMANALRPDTRGTVVLRAHLIHHPPDGVVDVRTGRYMHICCCNCDPWSDPPYTNCWWTWWSAEQQQDIEQHLRDYHPRMYQVLYRCPVNRHHDQHFTDMAQWFEHLVWECTNLNNSNNNNEDADSNHSDQSEESDHSGDQSENAEDEAEDEANENNEAAAMPEYQQVLYHNIQMLQAQFPDDEEINFYQGNGEEDSSESDNATEEDTVLGKVKRDQNLDFQGHF